MDLKIKVTLVPFTVKNHHITGDELEAKLVTIFGTAHKQNLIL